VVYQLAAFGLQNNKKRRKKRLGEARKQVAEGATLKLVKEKSEKNGSNRNDLSQKRVLFLFAEGDLTASYSFLRGIVQARLPSALVSYVISLRSVLRLRLCLFVFASIVLRKEFFYYKSDYRDTKSTK